MQSYGTDRSREIAGKVILQSRIPKGWTPRTPKSLTQAEYPGTAVFWDDEYFEVVSADVMPNGVRYTLEPWRDDHTIRVFEHYNEETEARRVEDWERAQRQRRYSVLARLSGIILGQFPAPVQNRLANELGTFPMRMTLVSCIPSIVLLGVCIWLKADAMLRQTASPVPTMLWILAVLLIGESGVRFHVAMLQNRGMGTFFGTIAYVVFWLLSGRRASLPSPFTEPGDSATFMIPPTDDVALQDAITVRGPFMTLLSADEQRQLEKKYGFNYREHSAFSLTWSLLVVFLIGVVSSLMREAFFSFITALILAVEQIIRLFALRRGPTGSMLGFLVRPFVRKLL